MTIKESPDFTQMGGAFPNVLSFSARTEEDPTWHTDLVLRGPWGRTALRLPLMWVTVHFKEYGSGVYIFQQELVLVCVCVWGRYTCVGCEYCECVGCVYMCVRAVFVMCM